MKLDLLAAKPARMRVGKRRRTRYNSGAMKFMKAFFTLVCVVWIAWLAGGWFLADYHYDSDIQSFWILADRTSTLDAKAAYVDMYVKRLNDAHLEGSYNALVFKKPNNGFDANFSVLSTLQLRLHEIAKMPPTSLQYQQAISQITAQEQGQADDMLEVFKGCWMLVHHPFLWGWVYVVNWLGCAFGCLVVWAIFWAKGS